MPFELYQFVYGNTSASIYRYTTHPIATSFFGAEWTPIASSRDNFKASGKSERSNFDMRFPVLSDISRLFTAYPPTQVVHVTVWAGHVGANDPVVVQVGRVLSTAKVEKEIKLTCESTLISMKRPGLRRNWQYGCPYVLYNEHTCKADIVAATTTLPVIGLTDTGGVVLQADWYQDGDPSHYYGGMLRWQGDTGMEWRTILNIGDDGSLRIAGPLRGLSVGDTVDVIKGCNHQESHCQSLHNNILNYGGQPWIPNTNPVRYPNFW